MYDATVLHLLIFTWTCRLKPLQLVIWWQTTLQIRSSRNGDWQPQSDFTTKMKIMYLIWTRQRYCEYLKSPFYQSATVVLAWFKPDLNCGANQRLITVATKTSMFSSRNPWQLLNSNCVWEPGGLWLLNHFWSNKFLGKFRANLQQDFFFLLNEETTQQSLWEHKYIEFELLENKHYTPVYSNGSDSYRPHSLVLITYKKTWWQRC